MNLSYSDEMNLSKVINTKACSKIFNLRLLIEYIKNIFHFKFLLTFGIKLKLNL